MQEETKAAEEQETKEWHSDQLVQMIGALIDQKVASRIQAIEAKQSKTDATMEKLPGLVAEFQASLPQMINHAVQQQVVALMQQLPAGAAAPQTQAAQAPAQAAASPREEGGAGVIPLGMEVRGAPAPAVAPPQQPQQQLPAPQSKASDLVKQMGGGGLEALLGAAGGGMNPMAAMMGGGGGGGMIQQMLMEMLMKKFFGKEEERPPDPMQHLMGMANMINQFAEAMGMIVNSVDSIRSGFLDQRMKQAQIAQVEAKGEAEVIRALNTKKAGGAKK